MKRKVFFTSLLATFFLTASFLFLNTEVNAKDKENANIALEILPRNETSAYGGKVDYTIKVFNWSGEAVKGLKVICSLPKELEYIANDGSGMLSSDRKIEWNVDLKDKENKQMKLLARVKKGTFKEITTFVKATSSDGDVINAEYTLLVNEEGKSVIKATKAAPTGDDIAYFYIILSGLAIIGIMIIMIKVKPLS